MELISTIVEVEEGKLHIETLQNPNPQHPFVLFLHGASPKSQHTKFWTSIVDKIIPHCNPILSDRFGHGKSYPHPNLKIGIKEQINSIKNLIEHVLHYHGIEDLIIIGRSQGGAYATKIAYEIPNTISALGLIAPGSMKANYKYLLNWKKPVSVLWDVDDPIVKFENYQFVKETIENPKLFTVGKSKELTIASFPREKVKKSHAPELMAPELFEQFLISLIT